MKKTLLILIQFISANLIALNSATGLTISNSDTLYPPVNFRVDSLRALVTWDYPSITLLNEDFESSDILPAGWTTSTAGNSAWYITDNALSLNFYTGPHTRYAATNDFNAGQPNAGCCDYLVAPAVDLTLTDSAVLTFATRYTGTFNQSAYIELSIDNGTSWQVVDTLETSTSHNYHSWKQISVNLSAFAGSGGCTSAIVRFHADDNGQQASGWAVDDVKIMAYVTTFEYYYLWLNDVVMAITDTNSYQIDPESLVFGQQYKIEIAAIYTNGISPHDSVIFTNKYLPYPENLWAWPNDNACILHWDSLDFGNTGLESALLGYIITRDGSIIDTADASVTEYWDLNLDWGTYCYTVCALYDLTTLGYPGQAGKSYNSEPVYADLITCCGLPFIEDWTAGTFDLNYWEHGNNWVIDYLYGNPYPCARFRSLPELADYESSIEIWPRDMGERNTATPFLFTVQFDLALNDSLSNGTEELLALYKFDNDDWHSLISVTNQGDIPWTHYSFYPTLPQTMHKFYFKFTASGEQSSAINSWFIDNLKLEIKYLFYPVSNLTATPSNADPFTIDLEWNSPVDSLNLKSTSATDDLYSYHIFRRALYPQQSAWEDIATTTKTWYVDDSLASNCYDYYVKAYYTEGSSVISNIDSLNCIDVGIAQAESADFRVYPNPVTHLLQWETDKAVKEIMLYDSFGRTVYKKSTDNIREGQIDVSGLPGGVYLVSFVCSDSQRITNKVAISRR